MMRREAPLGISTRAHYGYHRNLLQPLQNLLAMCVALDDSREYFIEFRGKSPTFCASRTCASLPFQPRDPILEENPPHVSGDLRVVLPQRVPGRGG